MAATWCLVFPLVLGMLTSPPASVRVRTADRTVGVDGTAATVGGSWAWPVVGPVVRGFDPPQDPYGSGHRGIDIAVPIGTPIVAPESGVVTFAGSVGGELFVTLDHGGGLRSSYSWLSARLVREGDAVPRGAAIGLSGAGHPGSVVPHLHLGVRLDGAYVDPLAYLGPVPMAELVHLAPDVPAPAAA
ncbi:MAG TPA: M23 family metallopeptidase [Actinomycetota bacterium]|nr:M23 family metallopeptidase [Actinomycetota bacterium]